jgi:predicted RNA-binding Zn ribbon-like protein
LDTEVNMQADPSHTRERAFQLISGHRALDLLATLRDRHRVPTECLSEPADLDRWLALAGFDLTARSDARDLREARALREAMNEVTRAALDASEPPAGALAELNRVAERPPLVPQLSSDLGRSWNASRPVQAALAMLAREAVDLLSGPDRALIRECAAAPNCSRLYLDRSPGRRRRWCHMDWCGSRAKMTAYRQRRSS